MIKNFFISLLGFTCIALIFTLTIVLVEKNKLIDNMQDCIEHADYLMQCDSLFDKDGSDYMSEYLVLRDSIYNTINNNTYTH